MLRLLVVVVLILALICLFPMLFLWALNSLAEAGGSAFYIKHTIWNYFLALIFLMCVRGESIKKS